MMAIQWIVWVAAISSGAMATRVTTVMGRGSNSTAHVGWKAILNTLNFPAMLVLMIVPFFVLSWPWAIGATVLGSFLNPAMFSVTKDNMASLFMAVPYLCLLSISGAVYLFAVVILGLP